jgi:hypothetical protein
MEERLINVKPASTAATPVKAEKAVKAVKLICNGTYTNLKITLGVLGLLCVGAFTFFLLVHYL